MQPIGGPSRPLRNTEDTREAAGARTGQALPSGANPPAPPLLVTHPANPNPPLHTVPPGDAMNPRYRPGSPTHQYLHAQALMGRNLGEHMGPTEAAGMLEMTREQAAATHLFKQNLDAIDPSRTLRNQGEFGQAYTPLGDAVVANSPLHFEQGGQVTVPPRAHQPGTGYIIHSHPPGHPGFPTDADYYSAYIQSEGNRNEVKSEIMYDAGKDKFFAYQGRLHPETGGAAYHELVNPFDMGPKVSEAESVKMLPDPETYGQHFINWPESRPGSAGT